MYIPSKLSTDALGSSKIMFDVDFSILNDASSAPM